MPATAQCRECAQLVISDAPKCKKCGALRPGDPDWKGEGYEWKSRGTWMGYPLVHVAFGCNARGRPRTARGVIAIGQRAIGAVAVGIVSAGIVAIGVAACGVLSLGVVSIGLACALGVNAIAPLAIGVTAIGIVAKGVAPVAWKVAPAL
ncbi:MAG: hypothetical protein ABIZ56_12225 [Chthoniobacteraceae bacterium]